MYQLRAIIYTWSAYFHATIPLASPCIAYNGLYPNSGERVCCALSCGTCGSQNCGKRPGGRSSCCTSAISTKQICGVKEQMAPCHLSRLIRNEFSIFVDYYAESLYNGCNGYWFFPILDTISADESPRGKRASKDKNADGGNRLNLGYIIISFLK